MDLLHPQEKELILDDGSGNGRFSVAIAKKRSEVILLDINRRLLNAAKRNLKRERLTEKTETILGDIQNLPFKSCAFDKILCVHNLWYVPDYGSGVREMLRTLKEGGKVVIDHLNALNWRALIGTLLYVTYKIARRNPTPIFYRTLREIRVPFCGRSFEVWNLISFGGRWSVAKGEGLWSTRLIVRCSK